MNVRTDRNSKYHLRGVWISTVVNLDWPSRHSSLIADDAERVATQKTELLSRLDEAVNLRMNAVFFQVRPCSDAFYQSSILPWSAYLSGTLGKGPGFDPLQFVIEHAHRRNLELHAWFNPYRVSMDTSQRTVDQLSRVEPGQPASVYLNHPQWIRTAANRFVLDPGIPEARAWIIQGVMEVARKYAIDGIHFDDYFYYESSGSTLDDAQTFVRHGQGFSNKADWRRDNTYQLIKQLSAQLRAHDRAIKFGVSPAGVWRNKKDDPLGSDTRAGVPNYDMGFADTRRWVQEELIDYIAPQVYWSFDLAAARFDTVTQWWADVVEGKNVHLYIGQALYKVGVASHSEPQWMEDNGVTQINRQLAWNVATEHIHGSVLFRHGFLRAPQVLPAISRIREEVWKSHALIPPMPWKGACPPDSPVCVQQVITPAGIQINWQDSCENPEGKTRYYALYRFHSGEAVDVRRADRLLTTVRRSQCPQTWTDTGQHASDCTYAVTALDRGHQESLASIARRTD